MTVSVCESSGLLQAATARLDRAEYAAIPWDRAECAIIAAEALHRAVGALRHSSEGMVHPLGFVRIPLTPWRLELPRIAVHVWKSDWPAANNLDIHDHCYDFVSICIAGEICHSFFEQCPSADGHAFDALHYSAGCCAESHGASGDDQSLALVDERIVGAYDAVSLRHGELHRARPLTDVAITVQFQSPCIKPTARVFRAPVAQNNTKGRSAKPLSHGRLVSMLESASR